jgi:hypothetical protein
MPMGDSKGKNNGARKTKLDRIREQLASIRDQEKKLLEQERQEEELAATEIGRIVIDHLKSSKPFDDDFRVKVSAIITL